MSFYQFNSHIKLNADPIHPLHAVTKQYVDSKAGAVDGNRFQTGTLAVSKLPGLVGDVSSAEGTNNLLLIDSGVAPGVKFRVDVDSKGRVVGGDAQHHTAGRQISWSWVVGKPSTLLAYGITDVASTNGGTIGSALLSNTDASSANHAVRKSQVDTTLSNLSLVSAATGDIVRTSTETTPSGFLKANGGALSKTTYAALYAILGDTYSSSGTDLAGYLGRPWRYQTAFNTVQKDAVTNWTQSANSMPGVLATFQPIVTKNRLYLIGGTNSDNRASDAVYSAVINSDGSLGVWATGPNLPRGLKYSHAFMTKNRVYVFSGYYEVNGESTTNTNIYTAPINTDGTLGTWSVAGTFSPAVYYNPIAIIKDRVYIFGVYPSNTAVYSAKIATDGTIGGFSSTGNSNLALNVGFTDAVVTDSWVYLFCGYINGTSSKNVIRAPINADGTLGGWSTTTATADSLNSRGGVVVTKNTAYHFGSYAGIYTAPINTDGTLGAWVKSAAVPNAESSSQAVVVKNKVYLLSSANTTIYEAPFSGGVNDYQTLIADHTFNPSSQFRLPDWTAKQTNGLYYYIKY